MSAKPTHRHVKTPTVNGRYLSDYMEASERARRTILRGCKYPPIAKLLQHDIAKNFISKMLRSGAPTSDKLSQEATRLRAMMADTPFDRELLDVNADVLAAYALTFDAGKLSLDGAIAPPTGIKLTIAGVKVNPDVRLGLQRVTKANKVRTGYLTIRYAKGKPLDSKVGMWQSALLLAARKLQDQGTEFEPEGALCCTLDAMAGEVIPAPGDAITRFKNMEAACATIAGGWANIEPPEGAIFA